MYSNVCTNSQAVHVVATLFFSYESAVGLACMLACIAIFIRVSAVIYAK